MIGTYFNYGKTKYLVTGFLAVINAFMIVPTNNQGRYITIEKEALEKILEGKTPRINNRRRLNGRI